MAQVIGPDIVRQVVEAAYASAAKATQQQGQTQQLTPAQRAAIATGTAGLASGATSAAGTAIARAITMLATAPLRLIILSRVLTALYGAAYMEGAHEAAAASDGAMPPWTAALPIPEGHWDNWDPSVGEAASAHAGGGLARVLQARGIWIKEMSATQVNRVGDAVRESVENGRPLSEAIDAVNAIVNDAGRARLIAETEYARAMTMASRETYMANRVPMVQWLHQPGACPRCMENAAVSPITVTAPWPSGNVPVHPRCRCAEAPYIPVPGRP